MTRDHIQHVLDTVFNQGPAVLITGALTGIGRATALDFGREGARVVVSGRRDDEGQKPSAPCDLFVERSIQTK